MFILSGCALAVVVAGWYSAACGRYAQAVPLIIFGVIAFAILS